MRRSLPALTKFYEEHQDDRDRFEILAFHDDSVKSLEELQEAMSKLEERFWGGKKLPFPVLLDTTGATIRDYGISYFPTVILIDPEGKLIGETEVSLLAEKLASAATK